MSRGNIRLDRQDGDVASPLRGPGLAALYALYNSSAISTMTEKKLPNLPSASDGSKLLPSFQKNVDGSARFVMVLPRAYHEDPGLSIMARCEALHSGYEFPYRKFLDSHLEAGDVFIDIGAHFGIYSLSAVTAPCGDVRSLAVEPDSHLQDVDSINSPLYNATYRMQTVAALVPKQVVLFWLLCTPSFYSRRRRSTDTRASFKGPPVSCRRGTGLRTPPRRSSAGVELRDLAFIP